MKWPQLIAALRLPLAVLGLSLVFSALAAVWSLQRLNLAQRRNDAAQAQLGRSRDLLERQVSALKLARDYLPIWKAWQARGLMGGYGRLDWLQAAQNADKAAGLYGFAYQVEPPRPAPDGLANGLGLTLTVMKLKLPLLVESDLEHFIGALEAQPVGLVRLRGCSLTRTGLLPPPPLNRPGLMADCELVWYTINLKTPVQP